MFARRCAANCRTAQTSVAFRGHLRLADGSSAGVCIIARLLTQDRRLPMTRLACAALILLSGFASVARAADPEPSPPSGMPQPTESASPGPASEAGPPGSAGPVVPAAALGEETPM